MIKLKTNLYTSVLYIIVLSVLLRLTAFDYPFGILKHFLKQMRISLLENTRLISHIYFNL